MNLPAVSFLPATNSVLASGGTSVPHAARGMAVTGANGYVEGTFLDTDAVGPLLTKAVGGTAFVGVGGSAVARGLLWLAG